MTSTPDKDRERLSCLQQQQIQMLRNRATTSSLAEAGPQSVDPCNTGTNQEQVTRGELDQFLLTEPLIARRAQVAARRARQVLGEIDLCPPVDRRTHQTKAFRYFKQAMKIVMSECPIHYEGNTGKEDLAANHRGCTSGTRPNCTIPILYVLASENLDNFLELMQGLDTPARELDRSNPPVLTSRAQATGGMIYAAELSVPIDGVLDCNGGKDDKSPTAAPPEQCARRADAEMDFSLALNGSRRASPTYWQPGRTQGEPSGGNAALSAAGDRPCSRASSDPARWSRGLPVDKTFPPRPQTQLPTASSGVATDGNAARPGASSTDPLDEQRFDDDVVGEVCWRRTTRLCAKLAEGISDENAAVTPTSCPNKRVEGIGWSANAASPGREVSSRTVRGGHASFGSQGAEVSGVWQEQPVSSTAVQGSNAWPSPSVAAGFPGGYLAPGPDQGALVAGPFLPVGFGGDKSLRPQGWVGAGEGESWLRVPTSTTTTADDASITASPLNRMNMSNTFDSEAAVAGGAFDDRNLSFDSSISHASDTDMVCFEHITGDGRRNFSLDPGYGECDQEDVDEGSEENFPNPDPSDPADGGLPCLSRGFGVGSATAAVS